MKIIKYFFYYRVKYFFSSLFLISPILLIANFDFNANCQNAFTEIFSLRFKQAKILLENEKKLSPSNKITLYLENYIDVLSILISEDKILYDKLKHNKTERINSILSDKDVNSPYYNLCQAEINFQWALASIKFKDYFAAANEVNKAYKLLTLNNKLYPAFYPNLKYLGLLHILIGSVPDDYQWILKILKFRGKLSEGIKEMERLSQLSKTNPAYHHLFIENSVYLSYIYINFNNEKEKLNQLEETVFKDSLFKPLLKTPLIAYCRANIAVNTGHNDFAIKILSELNYKNINFFPFYYLDYFKGLVKLNRLDRDADVYLLNFLNNYKGKNYLKAACQKLAWFYLINDDKEGYLENINKIGVLGENNVDEDKQAYREYLSKEAPDKSLLKTRLLCDGAYFDLALDALTNNAVHIAPTQKNNAELSYRLARIYHNWNKITKAISYYELTVKNYSELKYYYAANSALQLGLIYEKQKDLKKAEYYYKKCLTIKTEEYVNSIRQKAKAGLRRIFDK